MCFACVNFFFFLFLIIAGSTGPIFTIFLPNHPNDRNLFLDDRSRPLFPIPPGMLPWQPILWQNVGICVHWAQ